MPYVGNQNTVITLPPVVIDQISICISMCSASFSPAISYREPPHVASTVSLPSLQLPQNYIAQVVTTDNTESNTAQNTLFPR
ncbi:MAG: hypothetical protein B1H09_02965 [Gemmatimonadaceae bacterium 4484_173]|nr:MAG: hypothetical protein B1H09_02965 [Gemmatimonadaceae bacterium 4484_173]RKZ03948.1 MAG: hypothetical protein DRQ21_04320 [Candidatus Fermentibacteria bacterium]